MSELAWYDYLLIFASTSVLSLLLTPLALRLALRLRVLDSPGDYKQQAAPVPYLGGLAIVLSFVSVLAIASLVQPPTSGLDRLLTILGLGSGLAILGLIDDIKGMPIWLRAGAEVGAAVALFQIGIGVQLFESEPLNLILSIAWIVGITNAFNLVDNMDGLSSGVATIAAGTFFIIAAANGQYLVAALSVALMGCALGFLRHNFPPAVIYMGDAGSLFMGFMLAVLGILLRFPGDIQVTFFVPVMVLGVAVFDTSLVVVCRLQHGRSPVRGGRDHTSHRLVFLGIPVRSAVALIYAGAIGLGWLALVMSRVDVPTGFILMGFVIAVCVFFGIMLSRVPVYETSPQRQLMVLRTIAYEDPRDLPEPSPEVIGGRDDVVPDLEVRQGSGAGS